MSYTLRRRLIFAWIFADVSFTIFRVNLFFADAEIEVILRGFRGYQIYNSILICMIIPGNKHIFVK